MLPVLITIDTEYSSGLYANGAGRQVQDNFDLTIACKGARGESGIFYQMEKFKEYGIRAVFFVDPMPALIWGQAAVDAVVHPILAAGHEVQLHAHTEWLEMAEAKPFGDIAGQNIKDFTRQQQAEILGWAKERLVEAGTPPPTAFRSGNYGSNDDTLRALADIGITIDSSFAPGLAGSHCAISLPMGECAPVKHCGINEWPIAALAAKNGWRHGQITALSFAEMRAAISHARQNQWRAFVLVSHSFELFDRNKARANPLLMRRFEKLCAWIGGQTDVQGMGFNDLPCAGEVEGGPASPTPIMAHRPHLTLGRMAQQVLANYL